MINSTLFDLFYGDSKSKQITIAYNGGLLTNDNLRNNQFKLNESLCSSDSLDYGSCEAGSVEFTITNNGIDSLVGKTIIISIVIDNQTTTPITIGTYTVESDKLSGDRTTRNITAYDALYKINNANVAEWYKALTFPMTIKAFRDSFFNYFNVVQETTTLINDSLQINETIGGETISGAEVIRAICQLNGVFGHIGRDNTFKYISLEVPSTMPTKQVITPSQYKDFDFENYSCNKITGIQIRQQSNDLGVLVGTETNCFIVENNFLAFGLTPTELKTVATNLLNKIKDVTYIPVITLDLPANPCFEVGDAISVNTTSKIAEITGITSVNTFILERSLNGIMAMDDSYTSQGVENYDGKVNSFDNKLIQLRGKTAEIEVGLEQASSKIQTIQDNYVTQAQLTQTSDSINAQIEYIQQEIDGEVTMYYVTETPTLENYPADTFTYNIPVNNTVKVADDLAFLYTNDYYRKNLRAIAYDTETNTSYRFQQTNGVWGWVEIADTEYAILMQKITALELTTEGIETNVEEVGYKLENDYFTKAETNSKIQQSANSITSTVSNTYETKADATTTKNTLQSQITQTATEVSSKVSKGSVVSEINQSADQITLNSNRLVVNSNNFKLTATGDVTCSNANITDGNLKITKTLYFGDNYSAKVPYDVLTSLIEGGVNISNGSTTRSGSMGGGSSPIPAGSTYQYILPSSATYIDSSKFSIVNKYGYIKADFSGYDFDFNYSASWVNPVTGWIVPAGRSTGSVKHNTVEISGSVTVKGTFYCTGTKSRMIETVNYGNRLQNAYETCEPYFGDIGEDTLNEEGVCIVPIEAIFSETVSVDYGYRVFLQAYGEGSCYVAERNADHFIVKGTANMPFAWELKARQKGYENVRLEQVEGKEL